jgi:hypothetical protein
VSLALFLGLLVCFGYFLPRWADWNVNSRFDLVISIVDDRTLTIDRLVANTGDYADYNGHYYSDKAPGIALLAVPVYAAFEKVIPESLATRGQTAARQSTALASTLQPSGTGLERAKIWTFLALTTVTFVIVVLPAAALGVIFFRIGRQFGLNWSQSIAATVLYTLGTSAFPYANSLVGHQTSAFLLFGAFSIVFAVRRKIVGPGICVVVGFFIGYAAVTEYQTALIGVIVSFYALLTVGRWPATLARLVAGAAPALVALAVYDLTAFGTILPIGYLHSTLWSGVHQTGFVSLTYPHLDALWGITLGMDRGLFFLSPHLLFALVGYVALWRTPQRRPEFWVLLAAPLAFFAFNSSSAMWQGGFAVGPRYLVPALPFLAMASGIGLTRAWQSRSHRPLVVVAATWSITAVWAETIGGQSFPDYTTNPLINYTLPRLVRGDIARNVGMLLGLPGWPSLIPLLVLIAAITAAAVIFRPQAQDRRDQERAIVLGPGLIRWN